MTLSLFTSSELDRYAIHPRRRRSKVYVITAFLFEVIKRRHNASLSHILRYTRTQGSPTLPPLSLLNRLAPAWSQPGEASQRRKCGVVAPVEHYLVGCSIGCYSVQLCWFLCREEGVLYCRQSFKEKCKFQDYRFTIPVPLRGPFLMSKYT
jgi:hypothetical protein